MFSLTYMCVHVDVHVCVDLPVISVVIVTRVNRVESEWLRLTI